MEPGSRITNKNISSEDLHCGLNTVVYFLWLGLWVVRGGGGGVAVVGFFPRNHNYKVRGIRKLAQYRLSIKIQLPVVRQLIFPQPQSMNCECGGIRFISFLSATTDLEINRSAQAKFRI